MPEPMTLQDDEADWIDAYRKTRAYTECICSPLETDDYQLQSIVETSPPKWHIAHVSWFFETFLLTPFLPGYRPYHPRFGYLFNSYYETVGHMHPRSERGMLSRPTVETVYTYRAYVDEHMLALLSSLNSSNRDNVPPAAGTESRAAAPGTVAHGHQAQLLGQLTCSHLSHGSESAPWGKQTCPLGRVRGRNPADRCYSRRFPFRQ